MRALATITLASTLVLTANGAAAGSLSGMFSSSAMQQMMAAWKQKILDRWEQMQDDNTGGGGDTGGGNVTPDPEPEPVPTTQTLQLVWTAPSAREDGSPLNLSELQGYELVYYSDQNHVEKVVNINGSSSQQYQVTLDTPDTYHFAVAAIDSKGVKSELSEAVSYTFSR